MGRPKKDIDEKLVMELAGINCTMNEIATIVKCSVDTLENRFSEVIKQGRDGGKSSLRRLMWGKCKEGNVTMMIWLSKQILGYSDKIERKENPWDSVPTEQKLEIAKQLVLTLEKEVGGSGSGTS